MLNQQTIDLSLFYNEFDLLELRLQTLYQTVDLFVVVESTITFSGKQKPLLLGQNLGRYRKYFDKLRYYPLTQADYAKFNTPLYEHYRTPLDLVLKYKHNQRKPRWLHPSVRREIRQRDAAIMSILDIAQDDDLIIMSDADEIPSPEAVQKLQGRSLRMQYYFQMKWYLYYINNKVNDNWLGSVAFQFNYVKFRSLDQLRIGSSDLDLVPTEIIDKGGWHFSYLGGEQSIKNKLSALAYQGIKVTILSLLIALFPKYLGSRLHRNADILFQGRDLFYVAEDEEYPKPLTQDSHIYQLYTYKS